jgi:hypothetical protein
VYNPNRAADPWAPAHPQEDLMLSTDLASNLLAPGETAVALFTRGAHLTFARNGPGASGNWVLNPARDFDRVILYLRRPEQDPPQAEVYVADFVETVESPEPRRYVVRFRNARLVGTTTQSWSAFAECGANPVRYLSKP